MSALQGRPGVEIPVEHPIICYAVDYAATLLNRFEVSSDGKTAYERSKGKKATTLGIEFGEAVLWRRKKVGGALAKMTSLWEDGVYLGVTVKSGEMIVGDGSGVWKTRSVNRKPLSERWGVDNIALVVHPPWRTSDQDPNMDGEAIDVRKSDMPVVEKDKVEEEAPIPRRLYLRRSDFEVHGFTTMPRVQGDYQGDATGRT